ncbi:hypothetical protein K0M31_002719 [Melipona bicolor]|uniref:Uncharacterized protein n=1 Tax=Melipona bicolor TaxID=60889 RepID=A0AA40KPV7_9HYME|nr:hypothetical protein K0M31_002719 [Melipona bicolor]
MQNEKKNTVASFPETKRFTNYHHPGSPASSSKIRNTCLWSEGTPSTITPTMEKGNDTPSASSASPGPDRVKVIR